MGGSDLLHAAPDSCRGTQSGFRGLELQRATGAGEGEHRSAISSHFERWRLVPGGDRANKAAGAAWNPPIAPPMRTVSPSLWVIRTDQSERQTGPTARPSRSMPKERSAGVLRFMMAPQTRVQKHVMRRHQVHDRLPQPRRCFRPEPGPHRKRLPEPPCGNWTCNRHSMVRLTALPGRPDLGHHAAGPRRGMDMQIGNTTSERRSPAGGDTRPDRLRTPPQRLNVGSPHNQLPTENGEGEQLQKRFEAVAQAVPVHPAQGQRRPPRRDGGRAGAAPAGVHG